MSVRQGDIVGYFGTLPGNKVILSSDECTRFLTKLNVDAENIHNAFQ